MGVTPADAREELEAVIYRQLTRAASSCRDFGALADVVLAAADVYARAAAGRQGIGWAPGTEDRNRVPVHLAGRGGSVTACQHVRRVAAVTTLDPVRVTCGNCVRSRLYRDMTAGRAA